MNTVGIPRSNVSIKSRIPVPIKNSTSSNLNKNNKNVLQLKPSLLPSGNSTKPAECKDAHVFQNNIQANKSVAAKNKIIEAHKCKKGSSNPTLQNGTLVVKTGQIQKNDPKYVSKISRKENCLPSKSQQNTNIKQTNQKKFTNFNRRESVIQKEPKIGNKVKERDSLNVKSHINKNTKQTAVKVESDVNKKNTVQKPNSKVVFVGNDRLHIKTDFNNNAKEREHNSIKSKTEKNIPAKPSHDFSQKDVRFEASDLYRNMILSNRPLSPGILKSGLKLSSVCGNRTSVYQKENVLKDVLKEIENFRLSVQRNSSLALMQNKPPMSPFKDRNSFYTTPCADPKGEVMRSLEKLRTKKMLKKMKSEKKVTFDLNVKDHNPKVYDIKSTPFKNECRLTQISENSKENTPISPESKISENIVKQNNTQTHELKRTEEESNTSAETSAASVTDKISYDLAERHSLKFCDVSQFCTPVTKTVPIDSCRNTAMKSTASQYSPTFESGEELCNLNKLDFKVLSTAHIDSVKHIYTATTYKERNFQSPVLNRVNAQNEKKRALAKLCTPQPVSLFCKSSAVDISSPEFLMASNNKNSMLAEFAPICTPFVLKNLAKSTVWSPETDLSPVRIKLDFTEEKDTPKKEEAPTKSYASVTAENIATIQKKLDILADKECSLLLQNASIQMECGRYLKNPIAVTLDEGDEMHFLPIRF